MKRRNFIKGLIGTAVAAVTGPVLVKAIPVVASPTPAIAVVKTTGSIITQGSVARLLQEGVRNVFEKEYKVNNYFTESHSWFLED